ncbi:DUF1080 domain-containing protein [Mucilaginibacter myungsuensis]|uniref:DUF1080 domain-containing protein n=1 Tax=Mucilaginibacter myungsuensis TaxID=649104 RepID=A0A929L2L3_9SPHI|nr:family 16 glycoside hydrolase [Mucilaginibacter myungsuensis]MBE9664493.1 DUF1080 domain-containing protein [Mucilaginibacter myungsuensis]MDN3601362.1 DUF1080 domain-containing protein [Mucilaginibacter myungsuensis]
MKIKELSFLLIAAACLQNVASAQVSHDDEHAIISLLTQLPAKNAVTFNNSMAKVATMSKDGYVMLISALNDPRKVKKAEIEYTVGGFSAYATKPGNEAARELAVGAYIKALQKLSDKQNKQFIISQFDIVGTDEAVPALQGYLTDADLVDAATRALVKINTASSNKALLSALPTATGKPKQLIIDALGDAKYQPAVSALNKIAASGNTEEAKSALYALANIADPSSQTVLSSAASKAGYKYEPTNAMAMYVRYAETVLKKGHKAIAQKISADLSTKGKAVVGARASALKLSVDATKGSQPILLTAAGDADPVYRAAALRYALPYVTAANVGAWVKKLSTVSDEAKVDILFMLGQSGQKSTLPTILGLAKSKNDAVKQAAINAAVDIGNDQVLDEFFKMMATGTADDVDMLAAGITHMKGDGINQRIGKVLPTAPERMQVALIDIIDSRKDNAQWPVVWSLLNSPNKRTKAAAYGVLGHIATKDNAKQLFTLLKEGKEEERAAVQDALVFLYTGPGNDPKQGLLTLARSNDAAVNQLAIEKYLQAIKQDKTTPENKFLKLREGFALARSAEQKQQIMKEMIKAPCFNTLIFAGKYLDDADLKANAANAVVASVLAGNYSGDLIKGLFSKALPMANADAKQKEIAEKYLADMKGGEGLVQVFNGTDLTGWKGLVADPIKRAAMDAKTLADAQAKADAEAKESWKVMNGELHFMSKGNNLATVKKYRDVEVFVDWKIIDDKKGEGDAGIYLRGSPQVQMWDLARTNVGAQVGSGGLYNNQVQPSKPLKVADNKLDEWNTFRILMTGDRVTVYLNGELVTDNVILENYWNRKIPIFAEEQIELQAHGSPVAYRDIYIREIPSEKPFELSKKEVKEGYKVLFDGTNMFNWTGNMVDYTLDSGTLAIHPKPGKGSGGNLYTKDEYSDFIFRFEFQLTPGANNGLGIRAPLEGDAAYTGMELQILDNEAPMYKDLHVYQYHGSIYGTIPAKRGFLKPTGKWNYQEVEVRGPKIKVTLNGKVILDADITEARAKGAADGKDHPGLKRDSGHIGFLGHGSVVKFKNIRIKDLAGKK